MKRSFRFLILALALLSVFTACSRKVSFTMERGCYRNGKTGVVYVPVSDNYRSTGYFEDMLAGSYRSPSGNVIDFYRVEGMDGVLTDRDQNIYLAEGVTIPDFSDFSLSSAYLCLSDAITVSLRTFDDAAAKRFRNAVLNGASLSWKKVDKTILADRYDLVFYADGLPLAYRLIYQEFSEPLLVYEKLTDNGEIPDLYPGVPAEKSDVNGEEVAVFRFGTQILYDRLAGLCYPIENLTAEDA